MDGQLYQLIAQYGSLGVLLWLVLYIFQRLLPQTLEQFRLELAQQREEFRTALQKLVESIDKQHQAIALLSEQIRVLVTSYDTRRAKSRADSAHPVRE
jgi:F0F1-type ATP synthase membrane subunit b/b'